jgi:hypothetical protein
MPDHVSLKKQMNFSIFVHMMCSPFRNRFGKVCALVAATLKPELAFADKDHAPVSSQPECGK